MMMGGEIKLLTRPRCHCCCSQMAPDLLLLLLPCRSCCSLCVCVCVCVVFV